MMALNDILVSATTYLKNVLGFKLRFLKPKKRKDCKQNRFKVTAQCLIAFTLPELLITIGVIGLIAAIACPVLIQFYKKQTYVTGLKKSYSALQQAFNNMMVTEGVSDFKNTVCGQHFTAVKNENVNLITGRTCFQLLMGEFKKSEEVQPSLLSSTTTSPLYINSSNGKPEVGDKKVSYALVTADGITYLFDNNYSGNIMVDVNGLNKIPNTLGRDLFAFYMDETTDFKLRPMGVTGTESSYLNNGKDCIEEDSATNPSKSKYNTNLNCTQKVLSEGKMNY